ncbi:MAG TPA: hypothetical protein VM537_01265 [Anaerolineae bacterium]|nr:hypothetical protein [Anaerolineae bacterium]HUX77033.1 hypothetical protein [Anaerolineae bacterium]
MTIRTLQEGDRVRLRADELMQDAGTEGTVVEVRRVFSASPPTVVVRWDGHDWVTTYGDAAHLEHVASRLRSRAEVLEDVLDAVKVLLSSATSRYWASQNLVLRGYDPGWARETVDRLFV